MNTITEAVFTLTKFDWCYIIAISLQVAGAVFLIIRFWGNVEKRTLDYYTCPKVVNIVKGNITLKKEDLRECATQIVMNRIAFVYIIAGYICGVFGKVTIQSKAVIIVLIIVGVFALLLFGRGISICLPKHRYREDIIKEYNKKMNLNVGHIEF